VTIVGAVCANTRFEGLVVGEARQDGWNATDALCRLLLGGKYLPQLHVILLDGIAIGGFNVIDLEALARRLKRPCVAVMRRPPDMAAVEDAVRKLPRSERRIALLHRAGPIHITPPFVFQVRGALPQEVGPALALFTDTGKVPEPLRLAHLIGGAIARGESTRRA